MGKITVSAATLSKLNRAVYGHIERGGEVKIVSLLVAIMGSDDGYR